MSAPASKSSWRRTSMTRTSPRSSAWRSSAGLMMGRFVSVAGAIPARNWATMWGCRSPTRSQDVLHEGVDAGADLGAEVEVVGVLVHVERQDDVAVGQRVGVIGCPD